MALANIAVVWNCLVSFDREHHLNVECGAMIIHRELLLPQRRLQDRFNDVAEFWKLQIVQVPQGGIEAFEIFLNTLAQIFSLECIITNRSSGRLVSDPE